MSCGRCDKPIAGEHITFIEIDGEIIHYHYKCGERQERTLRRANRRNKESK